MEQHGCSDPQESRDLTAIIDGRMVDLRVVMRAITFAKREDFLTESILDFSVENQKKPHLLRDARPEDLCPAGCP